MGFLYVIYKSHYAKMSWNSMEQVMECRVRL